MEAGVPAPSRSRAERRAQPIQADASTAALTILGQKWVMRIIRTLGTQTQRFCELQDALGGANSATLSQRLKLLEGEGLITRTLVSSIPPWVEYSLTQKGRELHQALGVIDGWAYRWAALA
ncbi:MAG: helix-turn-helix transcriptional regulator [Chloroflexota bacterium]|nr:helix-turn-helix transcriptional regulator [Chloroflexota bacterium]